MLKELGRQRQGIFVFPMFRGRHDAFGLHPVDDLVRVDGSVGIQNRVHEVRDLLRRNARRRRDIFGLQRIARGAGQRQCEPQRPCPNDCQGETHGSSFRTPALSAGRVMTQVVPWPSGLSNRISPPNFLISRCATVRPSPDPSPCPLVV